MVLAGYGVTIPSGLISLLIKCQLSLLIIIIYQKFIPVPFMSSAQHADSIKVFDFPFVKEFNDKTLYSNYWKA